MVSHGSTLYGLGWPGRRSPQTGIASTITPITGVTTHSQAGRGVGRRPSLAPSVLSHKIEERLVELGRVLPEAGVAALGGGPPGSGDLLVDPPRQRDGDEDVFRPGQHQRGSGDLTEPVGGVMVLDHGELRQVRMRRLVHVAHRGLELREVIAWSAKNGCVNAHKVTSRITNGTPRTGAISPHMANLREQNGPGAAYVPPKVAERR